ncbi:hypothetical protein [Streptomyces sp. CB01881]|uniref:hypothetical protein n=1 Tax=Streptomyces sp. CB01881 TaxID=2078691 RepID=UPI000CDBACF0|nr:hypothetical protein [Streptomyces sp. CB01881]AUY50494.1 hypothetical protein C2142_17840 [Streptomyces sp. CB01881]TYC73881.1 hypothetical protein EH183_17820 [Streptomyces sp. CB01881]
MVRANALDATVAVWHWYSIDQARAATLFSRRCGELERNPTAPSEDEKRRGLQWSVAEAEEHKSYAVASILASVAFLEASLNELLGSASEDNLELAGAKGGLPPDERRDLTFLMKVFGRRTSLLERIELVLELLGREPFEAGTKPFQDARLVVQLRNELVHYRPEWRAGAGASQEALKGIAKGLSDRSFTENPFTSQGNPFFPDRCLGHGCAAWAWMSMLSFANAFFERVGVTPIYDDMRDQLKP